jgi:hypothetical protein
MIIDIPECKFKLCRLSLVFLVNPRPHVMHIHVCLLACHNTIYTTECRT